MNTTGPASTLELWMRRNSNSQNDQSVGIIFEGPSITTGGGAQTITAELLLGGIQVKDGAYASFSKDDTIYFFIKWVRNHTSGFRYNRCGCGTICCYQGNNSGSNLTSGATGANIHLNMIYLHNTLHHNYKFFITNSYIEKLIEFTNTALKAHIENPFHNAPCLYACEILIF